jgi:hypothetical protein
MFRWLAAAAALAALAVPADAAAGILDDFVPLVVHDSRERYPLTSVRAFAGRVPGVPAGEARPVVYGRRTGHWLQYWMLFAADTQDWGLLHTGRHEGDWELVQLRLRRGRPVRAFYSQHSGAESCSMGWATRLAARPVAYVAQGSHALYFVSGVRDRIWPAPNDEADGRGLRMRPRLVRISADSPPWMRYSGRWGATRAGWFPGEMSSPRSPAQQRERWTDPDAWAAAARRCSRRNCDRRGECDERETAMTGVVATLALGWALLFARRRMRRSEGPNAGNAPAL